MSRPPLDETLRFGATKVQFRIPEDDWEVFKAVVCRYNRVPAKVLRELVSWYVATKKCIHGVPVHGGTVCEDCKRITEGK